MSSHLPARLQQIHDELAVQAHLFKAEARDEWHRLVVRLQNLERALEQKSLQLAEKVGKAEEHIYIGSESEIEELLTSFKRLHDGHRDSGKQQ